MSRKEGSDTNKKLFSKTNTWGSSGYQTNYVTTQHSSAVTLNAVPTPEVSPLRLDSDS